MDHLGSRIKNISSELKEYLETRINLIVLNIGDQVTQWIGLSLQKLIGLLIIGCGFLFALIGLAIYLGELLNNSAIGFIAVSTPLFIIGFIFILIKPIGLAKTVQEQLMSGILDALEEKKDDSKLALTEKKDRLQTKDDE